MFGEKQPQEGEGFKSNLNQIFMVLNTDARKRRQMMCNRIDNSLSFYTLFESEEAANAAYEQLVALGQNPTIEDGRKVFLTADFPESEIDDLANTFNSIPRKKE